MTSMFWAGGPESLRQTYRDDKSSVLAFCDLLIERTADQTKREELQLLRARLERGYEDAVERLIAQSLF
jgi:hypothetical protein